jgi:hypothetical protein
LEDCKISTSAVKEMPPRNPATRSRRS